VLVFQPVCATTLLFATLITIGCAQHQPTGRVNSGNQSWKTTTTGVKHTIDRVLTQAIPKSTASTIASRYPFDQVPHTLLKKPISTGSLTSGFGYRMSPSGIPRPKKHKGVDYAAPAGTPVIAAGDGVVVKRYVSSSYGKYIRVRHSNGFETAYAHLSTFADNLIVGSRVTRGQQIGAVGSSGRSTAPHLHYELIYRGTLIDPLLGTS